MDQSKIAELIKKIRKENNLTQKEFANKYNVTYQAVSKWENGLNLPDMSLLRQISKDYNISLDDILDGEYNKKENKNNYFKFIIIVISILLLILILFLIINNKNNDFEFKTIESNCDNFIINGSIAYNNSKTSIYISSINYCGKTDKNIYKSINCILYEKQDNIINKIDSYNYNGNTNLEDFLKKLTFNIDNYSKVCKYYTDDNLYIEIDATNSDDNIIKYKIPLKLDSTCKRLN